MKSEIIPAQIAPKTEKELRREFLVSSFSNIWQGYKAEPNSENKNLLIEAVKASLGGVSFYKIESETRITFASLNYSGFEGYCFDPELRVQYQNKIPLTITRNWGKLVGHCQTPKASEIMSKMYPNCQISEVSEAVFAAHKADFVLSQNETKITTIVSEIQKFPLTAGEIIRDAKKSGLDISLKAMSELQREKEVELRGLGIAYETNNRTKSRYVKKVISETIKAARKASK